MSILVPISHGELLDKITILRIKAKRIDDREKVVNVIRELSLLEAIWRRSVQPSTELSTEEREYLSTMTNRCCRSMRSASSRPTARGQPP